MLSNALDLVGELLTLAEAPVTAQVVAERMARQGYLPGTISEAMAAAVAAGKAIAWCELMPRRVMLEATPEAALPVIRRELPPDGYRPRRGRGKTGETMAQVHELLRTPMCAVELAGQLQTNTRCVRKHMQELLAQGKIKPVAMVRPRSRSPATTLYQRT